MFKKFFIILSLFCFIFFIGSLSVKASVPPSDSMTYNGSSGGGEIDVDDLLLYIEDFENYDASQDIKEYMYETSLINKVRDDEGRYTLFGKNLTPDEIKLFMFNILYIKEVQDCRAEALKTTGELFPSDVSDGSKANAFLHCYWTMLLMKYTDCDFALKAVIAHENYEGNSELHKEMDLYNDNAAYDYYKSKLLNSEEELTNNSLIEASQKLLNEGKLIHIIFNYRYTREVIYYATTNRRVSRTACGNFYAYTNSDIPYNVPDTKYITVLSNKDGNTLLASL